MTRGKAGTGAGRRTAAGRLVKSKTEGACDFANCHITAEFRILYVYRFGSRKQFADERFAHVCPGHRSFDRFPKVLGSPLALERLP